MNEKNVLTGRGWGAAVLLVSVAVIVAPGESCPAATPAEVDGAIKKGVAWLWAQQKPGGGWEGSIAQPQDIARNHDHTWGGYSALTAYALLSAGERHQEPRMASAIDFLKRTDITGTYSLAMRSQVWLTLPQTAETRQLLRADTTRLLAGVGRDGPAAGLWDYVSDPARPQDRGGRFDHSVSQFGVLGLWAGAQGGATIPPGVWKSVDRAWRLHQYPAGGWTYAGDGKGEQTPTVSMTAAGVASLFITRDMIGPPPGASLCHGSVIDPGIEKGLAWLAANHAVTEDAYSFYAFERIGAAGGLKHFGDFDWYAYGTDWLVKRQQPDGSWATGGNASSPLSDTAFALLFLGHGRSPVLVNKLDYETRGPKTSAAPAAPSAPAPAVDQSVVYTWNQRPRDVANLVLFMRGRLETYLNWQTITLDTPGDELNDAPVLFVSGNKPLSFSAAQEEKLVRFVRQGGLILANADCPAGEGDPFTRSVVSMTERLFGYKFRPLPATHPLLAEQLYRSDRWKEQPTVLGLSNGVRELVVLCPSSDPGKAWQLNNLRTDAAAFELGTDVCLYAADKQNFAYKGMTHLVKPTAAPGGRAVRVARLKVGDNWDPEPDGWWRLAVVVRNEFGIGLSVDPVAPDAGKLNGYTVAHLTGTGPFAFTGEQRRELLRFVTAGGTLVIDAAGGNAAFADAAEKELAITFGGPPGGGAILDPGDQLYALPQGPIPRAEYRSYFRRKTAGRLNAPRVRGIKIGDRTAVYFSREDLTGGLVGQPVDGILGYTPETATAIMRNVIWLAADGK